MVTKLLVSHCSKGTLFSPGAAMTISTSSKRQRDRPRRDGPSNNRPSRPPKPNQKQHSQSAPRPRPTHFLALPIGHHPELRSAVSALTSSWLAHEPPIEGLDASIVINPRRLHLTLGVMTRLPSAPQQQEEEEEEGPPQQRDLASATALLASLAPRVREVLAHDPLRVPLGRLAVMQPNPARAHVLYVEPDVRSPDGRRLRAVCGACVVFDSFSFAPHTYKLHHTSMMFHQMFLSPLSLSLSLSSGAKVFYTGTCIDLVHGAFKEAGFLADERRPLK